MPLPITPQPSTPTRWMSVNSSAPGLGPGILERLAHFFGDSDEGSRAGQLALVGRADFTLFEPVEYLLQRHLHALVGAPVGAGDRGPSERQADARHEHQGLGDRERRGDEGGCRRHAPAEYKEDGGPRNPLRALLADVSFEAHQTESGFELDDLAADLRGARQRVATFSRQRALNRGERARLGLPGRPVGKMPFGLKQLFFRHPPAQGSLDRRAIAGNDSVRHDRPGTREPRPRPGRDVGGCACLLLQHGLAQVPVGNSDVLPERQDFVVRETVADVVFSGLELGGALDDALQRLATDEILLHQTFAFPLSRTVGKRSPDVLSGRARLPESSACAGASRSMKPLNRSIGMGKIVVELFSEAISLTVWRD